jgi:hypothetical protein
MRVVLAAVMVVLVMIVGMVVLVAGCDGCEGGCMLRLSRPAEAMVALITAAMSACVMISAARIL